MPRKGWESLSRDRRVRLERRGITRESYSAGASLGERPYSERRADAMRRYGMTPDKVTALRRANPELARRHDALTRLARSNPDEAKRQGRAAFNSLSASQKAERFTVHFESGDQETTNPLAWYH
jgi:hypothetical protein